VKGQSRNIIFLLLLCCTVAKSQDTAYMPYFQIENIYWEHQINATKIFSNYLNSGNRYHVILPQLKGSVYPEETFTQTIANAISINAKYFIIGKLKAKEDVLKILISLYTTTDSSLIWNDSLIARTKNDLDSVIKLFADYIGTDQKASNFEKKYTEQLYYPKELIKPYASFNFGASISCAYTMADSVENHTSAGYSFIASYDTRHFIMDLKIDFIKGKVSIIDIALSGNMPLLNTKSTPYIGGSIGYSDISLFYPSYSVWTFANNSQADGNGLVLFWNVGYLIKRNLKVKFRLDGSFYYPLFYPETAADYSRIKKPRGYILKAVVLI
jgi:hypothetical protein